MMREQIMTTRIRLHLTGLAAGLILSTHAFAADEALIAAAKKEGQVTWYTTQIVNQFVAPTAQYFEKKYGIKVNYVRAETSQVILRVLNEARAGKLQADIVDGTGMAALVKEGVVEKWLPESVKRLPKEYYDPAGYWTATNLYVRVAGYNTNLVKRGDEPKSYDDLLDPKWKGKMAWSVSPSPTAVPGFVGVILSEYGQEKGIEYLKKLAKQDIAPLNVSARQVVDMLMAGEYSIGGVTKGSPHPNAGKLLADFLISTEGQKLYADAEYLPVAPEVPALDPSMRPDGKDWRVHYLMPDEVEEKAAAWLKIYNDIFR
ncbi:MAG: extracellular solute-binding protein [Alphaproteobacteria bacterium]|nr:extracellular solute-binding protein [Alphaproteobacteria bacterium]